MLDHRWIVDTISDLNSEGTVVSIHKALEKLAKHLGLDRCILRNRVGNTDKFTVIAEYYREDLIPIDTLEPDMDSATSIQLIQQLLVDGKVCVNDITQDGGFTEEEIAKGLDWGCRSVLFLPLRYQSAVNGMIIAISSHTAREWGDDDHYTVQLLGETALAVWLHNQSLQALSDSRQQFQWALDASNDAIWDWNLETGVFYNTRRFYEMLGYDDAKDAAMSIEDFWSHVYEDDKPQLEQTLGGIFNGNLQSEFTECRMLTVSRNVIWIMIRGGIVKSDAQGKPLRAVGVYSNITTFKKTLQHLELLRQNAERANLAKTEFLARMSHEVRTPLNAVIGMLYLLEDSALADEQREKVHIVQHASKQLLGVLNDILDIARIESGKLALENISFALDDVVQNVLLLFAPQAVEKNIDLRVHFAANVPQKVQGDPSRLSQVLNNLLSNALKFTSQGTISLSVSCRQASVGYLSVDFVLADTGVGMTDTQIDQLFNPFVQAEIRIAREYGGSGLGLSICKSLVELMGGHITVKSLYDLGSEFHFTIRVGCEEPDKTLYYLPSPPAFTQVAVICQHAAGAAEYRELFRAFSLDADIIVFEDGEKLNTVLDSLTDTPFILIDIQLQSQHVHQLKESIDKTPNNRTIVLLAMSVCVELQNLLEQYKQLYLLAKPLLPRKLLSFLVTESATKKTLLPAVSDNVLGAKHLQGMRILLVEDNHVNQLVAKGMLKKYGADVTVCEHGKQAYDDIYEKSKGFYQAVLMDIEMPIMDGFKASRLIRQMEKSEDLPIIAMTANTLETDIQRCYQAGMNAHIAKPIDIRVLVETLLQYIKAQ